MKVVHRGDFLQKESCFENWLFPNKLDENHNGCKSRFF